MKNLACAILFLLIFCSVAYATCYRTSPGLVYINGHHINFWRYGNQFVETSCTAKRPGLMWWRGGPICDRGVIYYTNTDGTHGWCKVRRIHK